MEKVSFDGWAALFKADNLQELTQQSHGIASSIFGEERVEESWLVVRDELGQPPWWLMLSAARRTRQFLECPIKPLRIPALQDLNGHVMVYPVPPTHLFAGCARQQPDEPQFLPAQALVVLLGPELCRDGGWFIGLKGEEQIGTVDLQSLEQAGRMIALLFPRVLKCDRICQINSQLKHLHETMQQASGAADETELFNACLQVATRQFGFDRVLLALISEENERLETAVHTGFGPQAVPARLDRSQQDKLMGLVQSGELVVEEGTHSDEWPRFGGIEPVRRAAVPLVSGLRLAGVLYADQLETASIALHRDVLELFGRQIATGLENLKLRLHAERRAETDPLTGLHNRAFLDRLLELEIPRVRRYNHPISLLMIDLFDFKRVNDTWGHAFGDALLRETAQLLKGNVRRPDVVVRYGGDEFVVVMVNTAPDQARLVRRRIEQAFIDRNRLQEDERRMIHISIGLRSADAETLGDLLSDADQAMYAQKARQKRDKLLEALISGIPERIEAADRIVGNLCMMLYKKAPYYAGHARRVAALSALMGHRVGLQPEELEMLVLAGLLHGIGKVSLPAEILMKAEPLSAAEQSAVRSHVQIGDEFFEGVEHLEPLRPILLAHHERFDGDREAREYPAYPYGLAGERIPLTARILKLAEAVDTMLTDRPWRAARSPEETARIVQAESGHSFDPRLTGILLWGDEWLKTVRDPDSQLQKVGDLLMENSAESC